MQASRARGGWRGPGQSQDNPDKGAILLTHSALHSTCGSNNAQ